MSLISTIFAREISRAKSREYAQRGKLYNAEYFQTLAETGDNLRAYSGDDMDKIYEIVCRGGNEGQDEATVSGLAARFLIWNYLFAPYTDKQESYVDLNRLFDAIKKDALAYREAATFAICTPNAAIYLDLLGMDDDQARQYLQHCLLYIYANRASEPALEQWITTYEGEYETGQSEANGSERRPPVESYDGFGRV